MARQGFLAWAISVAVLFGFSREADGCALDGNVYEYWLHIAQHRCPDPDGCLERTSYIATRSDGRQVRVTGVYRWNHENAKWDGRIHLLPHFVLDYMRKLRDAYEECPDTYFHTQLFNQIDYLVTQGVTRFFPTARLPVLVWENRDGVAQGMEQAEMAAFLASAANVYALHGAREARGTMRYAFRAIESLFIPVGQRTGGVRSLIQTECGAKIARFRKCFWFHSRGVGIDSDGEDMFATVLNQHLHVIYDALAMYQQVNTSQHLVPREWGTPEAALALIEDRAIGGLYQLAFSRGNNSAAPTRPPNLAQFMRRDTSHLRPFYFSWYRFDLSDRTFNDLPLGNTCHYHTHTLAKMMGIKDKLDVNFDLFSNTPSGQGWRLYEAVDRLFAGAFEPMGQAGSTSAIWQFWRAQQVKYDIQYAGCPPCTREPGKQNPCSADEEVANYYGRVW